MTDDPEVPHASPASAPQVARFSSLPTFFQGLASAAVVVVGGLYAVGLLIVNLHLAQYGISSLDLARPEYAMAGVLWCLFTVTVYGAIDFTRNAAHKRREAGQSWWWIYGSVGVNSAINLSMLSYVLVVLSRGRLDFGDPRIIGVVSALVVNGFLVERLIEAVRDVAKEGAVSARMLFAPSRRPFVPNHLYGLLFAIVGIGMYATVVHPAIPREYGGGLNSLIRVFLNVPLERQLRDQLDASMSDVDYRSVGPVELIMESERFLIVARKAVKQPGRILPFLPFPNLTLGPAVGLDKKLISAIVYVPRQEQQQGTTVPKRPSKAPPSMGSE